LFVRHVVPPAIGPPINV